MEVFKDWNKEDFFLFFVAVVLSMLLAFLSVWIYNICRLRRLKQLKVPLKV